MPVADVSEGKDFPVAPLFATASIVPDEASHAVEEVDMPTAEATLNALDKVVRSFEAKPRLPVPPRAAQPLLIRPLARQGWLIFCILTSISLLTASMILLQRSQARYASRHSGGHACIYTHMPRGTLYYEGR